MQNRFQIGEPFETEIVAITDSTIFVDLSAKSEGVLDRAELADEEGNVSVKEGDKIVTSNISDKYLQGLLIGYVSEVTVDANNLTRSGYIIPATDFHELNEVLVITTTKKDLIDKKE